MSRFRWNTAGESHGRCLMGMVEGIPAGMHLDIERIDKELARRQMGYGRGGRMKIETDRVEVLAGTKKGVTLGSPVAFRVHNVDFVIDDLPTPGNPRPGHADLAGCQKFGHRDPRAVLERASARETAARVAAGGIARQVLEAFDVDIFGHVVELGGEAVDPESASRAWPHRMEIRQESDFLSLDPAADDRMRAKVDRAKEDQDTLGGIFEIRVSGLPPGLGSYASGPERLTSRLGAALFAIPAMKGVEFGLGFEAARRPGSEVHDAIVPRAAGETGWGRFSRASNRCGGLEGGMTNGETLLMRVAMKPIPSMRRGIDTVEFATGSVVRATYQRSDVTSVPAASVVGEAAVALCLTEAFLDKFASDSIDQLRESWVAYRATVDAV